MTLHSSECTPAFHFKTKNLELSFLFLLFVAQISHDEQSYLLWNGKVYMSKATRCRVIVGCACLFTPRKRTAELRNSAHGECSSFHTTRLTRSWYHSVASRRVTALSAFRQAILLVTRCTWAIESHPPIGKECRLRCDCTLMSANAIEGVIAVEGIKVGWHHSFLKGCFSSERFFWK